MGNVCRGEGKTREPRTPPKLERSESTEAEQKALRKQASTRRIETAKHEALKKLHTSRALSVHEERRRLHIQATRQKLVYTSFGGLNADLRDEELSEGEDRPPGPRRPSHPRQEGLDSSKPLEQRSESGQKAIFGCTTREKNMAVLGESQASPSDNIFEVTEPTAPEAGAAERAAQEALTQKLAELNREQR
ncbi:conserved hypothetical protein [Neospora caninum Liverpool]|uniref:Uncharacterized protein n=1 Tax=Neospora caninum (strain Liverpool) TaxID=572307 RepID=F0VAJ0_NEOCL|nr:conserved hypothetical protein [Neospora caninum Liverpool]CBZ50679.1 conserved hypothetical protein [Neospora caninum Liverpool]CEL65291.1 TPA: hypothetical protein BN1204_011450 [Neospora caninum Liverpool]|eukprot:XP_003880712.1 conserved hypothetical protein [Neospora caninum Liverpool]